MDATLTDLLGSDILLHYDVNNAASLFTDTGGTMSASNGNEVKCVKPQADAAFQVNLSNSTGPTYRSNYAASGYAALEFDGVNDALLNASTGMSTGQKTFIITAYTWISAAGTLWNRGNSQWTRAYGSSTTMGIQDSLGGFVTAAAPAAKIVGCFVAGSGQTQIDLLGFSTGDLHNSVSGSLTGAFTAGALNTGSLSQFGNFALHELLVIGAGCEWGQVLRASKLLRTKWGVSDPNSTPQVVSGGSSGFTGIRGISKRLGT